jgi:hypothetical protein
MTAPTDLPIEDRLRAHYANRTAQEPLPSLEDDPALARVRAAAERGEPGNGRDGDRGGHVDPALGGSVMPLGLRRSGVAQLVRRHPVRAAAVAAVAVALAVTAGVVARDDPSRVATDPATSATTVAPADGSRPTGPIVSAEGILGTWSGSEWVPWQSGDTPPVGDAFRIVRLDEPITTTIGEAGAGCAVTDEYGGVDVAWSTAASPSRPGRSP